MDADRNGFPPEYYYNVAGVLCCDEVLEEDKMDDASETDISNSPRCKKNLLPLFNASEKMHQSIRTMNVPTTSQEPEDLATSLSNSLEANLQIENEVTERGIPIARVIGQPRVRRNNSCDRERMERNLFNNESEVETTQFSFDDPDLTTPRPSVFQAISEHPFSFPFQLSPQRYELSRSEDNPFVDEFPPHLREPMSPRSAGRRLYMLMPLGIHQPEEEASAAADSASYYVQSDNFMHHDQPSSSYMGQQPRRNVVIQHQTVNVFPSAGQSFMVPQQHPGNGTGQNPYHGGPSSSEAPSPYQGMGDMAMPPNGPPVTTASWTNFM